LSLGKLGVFDYSPFSKPANYLPHGTEHSSFLICNSFEEFQLFADIDYFEDVTPPGLPLSSRWSELAANRRSLFDVFKTSNYYDCVYVPRGLLRSCPYGLRQPAEVTPVVAEVGTSHHPTLWRNILYSCLAQTLRPSDGFIFKSHRTRKIFPA